MTWGRKPPPLLVAATACALVALGSLALASGPAYDSYTWLIWGRELAHLTLSTGGTGTSWKPLPALVDALLTPLGGGVVDGWLVIARTGALMGVVLAFRLAWRLAPRDLRLLAGVIAAATLVVTQGYLRRTSVGDAEGLMAAFGLLAIDRHLDGRHRQAFWLIVVAALIRIEAWPFAIVYGAWLVWTGRARWSAAAGVALVALMWFGGDWLGSGSVTTGAGTARHPILGSPGAGSHPAWSVLQEAYAMLPWPAWVAIGVGLVIAIRRRALLVAWTFAGLAAAWTAIVAVMAQAGYPGLPRFLFIANALEAIVAGVGAALIVGHLARAVPRPRLAGAAALAVCALFAWGAAPYARLLPSDAAAIDQVADMDAALARAVTAVGGAAAVFRCGEPTTPWYTVTALDWDMRVNPATAPMRTRAVRPIRFTKARGAWVVRRQRCPKLA